LGKHGRKRLMPLMLVLVALSLLGARAMADPPSDWDALQQERQGLESSASEATRAEQAVVAEIFTLNRNLEETRAHIAKLDLQIADVTRQEAEAAAERDRLEAKHSERQKQFGVRLRYYSEQGNWAPVGFLLNSGSFADFLFRLDVIQMILERDARLIRELRELKAAVVEQSRVLGQKRTELTDLRTRQAAEVAKLQSEIARKESILSGLKEARVGVEAKVGALEQIWATAAKPVLESFGRVLQTVALKITDLTPDSVQFSLVPPGASVRVLEANLNQFIQRESDLKGLSFRLGKEQVNLEGTFSAVKVEVLGRFVLKGKAVLRYEPREIRFQDFALPQSVTDELLAAGRLDMDFSSLVGPWAVKEIVMEDGGVVVKAGLK